MARIENAPLNTRERFFEKEILDSLPVYVILEIEQSGVFIPLSVVEKVRKELLYDAYSLFLVGGAHPKLDEILLCCTLRGRDWELGIHLVSNAGLIFPASCAYTTIKIGVDGKVLSPCSCGSVQDSSWNGECYRKLRRVCQLKNHEN